MKREKQGKPGKPGKLVQPTYGKKHAGTNIRQASKGAGKMNMLKETEVHYSVSSKIRAIGNSKGVILSNRVIEEAGIAPDADLVIFAADGMILIAEAKTATNVNTDIDTWEAQFKKAIKEKGTPEGDLWKGVHNQFDEEEWT